MPNPLDPETEIADLENPNTPPDPSAASALDKALLEATGGEVPEGVNIDAETQEAAKAAADEVAKKAEADAAAKAAEEKKVAEAEAAKKAAEEAEKAKTPEQIEAEKKAAAESGDWRTKLDAVTLPPYTKPKAAEAFATVKTLALAQVEEARKEVEALKLKLKEAEEKAAKVGTLPPDTEKELAELRDFRAKLDVEADPKFKEWDTKVSENVEAIYAKLKAVGTTDEVIKKIKELGGPAELDWDSMADKLPSTAKRYIEGKLFENEDLTERKTKALTEAKSKASEYVKQKAEAAQNESTNRLKAVEAEVAKLIPNAPYANDKVADEKATAEEKAAVLAHNKRAADIRATMKEAIETDTPQMKSLLVLGIAQLQRVNGDFEEYKAKAEAEKIALETKLKAAEDLLEKIKKSSKPRLGAAPEVAEVKVAKVNVHDDGGSNLDRLLAEAQAKAKAA